MAGSRDWNQSRLWSLPLLLIMFPSLQLNSQVCSVHGMASESSSLQFTSSPAQVERTPPQLFKFKFQVDCNRSNQGPLPVPEQIDHCGQRVEQRWWAIPQQGTDPCMHKVKIVGEIIIHRESREQRRELMGRYTRNSTTVTLSQLFNLAEPYSPHL